MSQNKELKGRKTYTGTFPVIYQGIALGYLIDLSFL